MVIITLIKNTDSKIFILRVLLQSINLWKQVLQVSDKCIHLHLYEIKWLNILKNLHILPLFTYAHSLFTHLNIKGRSELSDHRKVLVVDLAAHLEMFLQGHGSVVCLVKLCT